MVGVGVGVIARVGTGGEVGVSVVVGATGIGAEPLSSDAA